MNRTEDFMVWVNEEDHLRIIAMEKGSDMINTFRRFAEGLLEVEERLRTVHDAEFVWHSRLGYNLPFTFVFCAGEERRKKKK